MKQSAARGGLNRRAEEILAILQCESMSQASRKLGIPYTSLRKLLTESTADAAISRHVRIARACGMSLDDYFECLLSESTKKYKTPHQHKKPDIT